MDFTPLLRYTRLILPVLQHLTRWTDQQHYCSCFHPFRMECIQSPCRKSEIELGSTDEQPWCLWPNLAATALFLQSQASLQLGTSTSYARGLVVSYYWSELGGLPVQVGRRGHLWHGEAERERLAMAGWCFQPLWIDNLSPRSKERGKASFAKRDRCRDRESDLLRRGYSNGE